METLLALALTMGTTPALATDWQVHDVTDRPRGTIGIGVTASGVLQDGSRKFTANLIVNCSDSTTAVFVESGGLSVKQNATVSFTLDRGSAQSGEEWRPCKGGDCIGLWNEPGIAFAQSLFDKAALKMLIARKYDDQVEANFEITGARTALQPVSEKCGWPDIKTR